MPNEAVEAGLTAIKETVEFLERGLKLQAQSNQLGIILEDYPPIQAIAVGLLCRKLKATVNFDFEGSLDNLEKALKARG